jgi:general secretion pathway protein L
LFLRLSESGVATWAAFDPTGRLFGTIGRGPLASVREQLAGRRCALLVDGIDVLTAQVDLPAASQARLRQIAPFSLEESLADDLEQLVFAIGARAASGSTVVAAVAKDRLEAWLAQLREAGIVPQIVCSEIDGVPEIPATLVLVVEGERIAGRKPGQPAFVFEGLSLRQAVDLALGGGEENPELRHVRAFVDEAGRERFGAELDELGERFASAEVKLLADGAFAYFAATLAQRPGTNLLQGPYAPKSNWLTLARPWRLAATLAAVSVGLAVLGRGAELAQLSRADGELNEAVAAACQRTVGQTSVSACQREVRQRLSADTGGSSEDFLSTLAAIAAVRGDATRVDGMSYRNRTLNLQLIAPSVPALDEFSRALEQTRRFDVEIEAANQTDSGTEGRVRVVGVNP